MTVFTKTAVDVFAAQDASGAARKVSNHDAQVWGTEVERALTAFQAGGGVIFQSKDQADANLGYDANTMAWVFDADPSLAGIYQKQGASGSGSWQRVGDLPYSFILATNSGTGTADAIQATTVIPIPTADGGALIALPIVADNTASPVTVSFNGETPLTIKTIAGNDVPASALASGMTVWGFKSGDEFRLVTDLSSAGILAGAEAAAEAAEDAADRAQSYSAMLSADKIKFKTVADLLADETMSYTPGSGLIEVGPGDIIEAQGFRYEVAASDAVDAHVETAGGVKLYEAGFVFTHIDRLARVSGSEEISFAKLTQGWRSGSFVWDGSDLSSEVAADPERGIYVPPISDATGASGAWVRQYDGPVRFEWWGADPSGVAVATASIQAALDTCVALGLEDIDASGSSFNMTGGTTVSILADGARIRVNKGNFFSTDGAEENTLFRFILLAEVEFIGSLFDRNYLGSTDIEDYNSAHAIACYGVGLFRVDNCTIRNIKGDGLYGARDRVDGVGTDRNMGDVFWTDNKLHNCKRNYMALTSYMNALIDGNICTSSGESGGTPFVWARSAVIDFEPNNSIENLGYATVTNNILKVTGAKNPLRWLVGSDRIPSDFYESVIVTGNTIECTGVLQAIFVDCREKLKYLKISENTVRCATMAASGSNPTGILVSAFTGLGGVNSNTVDIVSGQADTGIYYSVNSTTAKATANDNTIIYRPSGDFRGIRANVGSGAQITANGNTIIANSSSQQAILLSGQSESKATTLTANNNSYSGFTGATRIQVSNAVMACAIGNNGGGNVSGSSNDNQLVSPNI